MRSIASAALEDAERRALGRAVEALRAELGERLVAVWLYGSRARGEPPHADSDIDILVVVHGGTIEPRRVSQLVHAAAEAEGVEGFAFSAQVRDLRDLAREKAIESLYLREVEHDKIVLAGGEALPLPDLEGHELPPMYGPGGVMTRSLGWLDEARRHLAAAERLLEEDGFSSVIAVTAYYAMLYSARAALSEEGRVGRSHSGTWQLMRELLVDSGRFDAALVARAQEMQQHREGAAYDARTFTRAQSESHVRDARWFVREIERLIGAEPG